ncbi:MAG: NAD(P)H-hydrate epimerase [Anaerovoracaceae bacterium]|jgi:NAD(P)H-hydrate epimerase
MELYEKETVTCAEMKQLEQAGDASGVSYYQMMENAGTGAAKRILSENGSGLSCVILIGKGNNGGDGLVIARKLSEAGQDVTVITVEGEPVTEDAKTNFGKLPDAVAVEPADRAYDVIPDADVIVDALYGTGFHGTLRQPASDLVPFVNQKKKPGARVYAVDLPSGLNGDLQDGQPFGPCVRADVTITFHAKKPVHNVKALQDALGEVVVCDIGIADAIRSRK